MSENLRMNGHKPQHIDFRLQSYNKKMENANFFTFFLCL